VSSYFFDTEAHATVAFGRNTGTRRLGKIDYFAALDSEATSQPLLRDQKVLDKKKFGAS